MTVDSLSATFAALADPTRRAVLARLATGEATVKGADFVAKLPRIQADPGLTEDLARLGGEADDLGPIQ